ncbi:MAG: type II toxin-antitoxin system VapC family toxin [Dehalococcoidia bacterium]
MSAYLFDTDVIIDVLRRRAGGYERIERLLPSGLAVSVITYGELVDGLQRSTSAARATAHMKEVLLAFRMLAVDRDIAELFGRMRALVRSRGKTVADADLLIGSTALWLDLTVVTRNVKHFEHLPGLRIYTDGA